MNWAKAYVAKETNLERRRGSLAEMLRGRRRLHRALDRRHRHRRHGPLDGAGPDRLRPGRAGAGDRRRRRRAAGGARVVATGRSDYPNTMDVSLVFPGVFRGLLDSRARNIRLRTLLYAAQALADDGRSRTSCTPTTSCRASSTSGSPRRSPRPSSRGAIEAGEAGRDVAPGDGRREHAPLRLRGPPAARRSRAARGEHKTFREEAIELRQRHGGVLEIRSKIPIRDHHILNMLYVPPAALAPGPRDPRRPVQGDELTSKGNLVAIVTDGSAVLGLGDIGPQAALPVMEGKAVLFQTLAGVEAFPICLAARDPDEIVAHRAEHRAQLRRHQPGGHLRAALLRDRAQAARDASTCRSSTTTSTAPPSSSPPR